MSRHEWKWLEKDFRMDGSGVILSNGVICKITVQDLVSVKHRVAFIDGVEVARGAKFTVMLNKLDKVTKGI